MPSKPNNLTAVASGNQGVSLQWEPTNLQGDTVGYKILRGGVVIDHTSRNVYNDTTGLTDGSTYVYNIVSFNSGGTLVSGTASASVTIPSVATAVGIMLLKGVGDPTNRVIANVGTLYERTDGGASTSLYVKESGNGTSAGWTAK